MSVQVIDDHFRQFAKVLEREIAKHQSGEHQDAPDFDVERQKNQIETLVALEDEFRQTLIKHTWGAGVYDAFVRFICEEKRNVLDARPFFRERQHIFTSDISPALKNQNSRSLYRFHFNYNFVRFVMRARKWAPGSKVARLARRIAALRQEIVVENMPLAISRSKIFWKKTPKAQLAYMDFIQISCEGLMSAVDKFVLPYSKVFRSVAIGRIVGNFIEQYSETLVHFYPVDKRKIYRANKVIKNYGDTPDFDKLAEEVNKDVGDGHRTTAAEIQDLMAAASMVSADAKHPGEDDESDGRGAQRHSVESYAADDSFRPDVRFEEEQTRHVLAQAISSLPLIERKLLRMRGVTL